MTLVTKIVSGTNSGVERAAINFASEYGIDHCGWVPESQKDQFIKVDSCSNGIEFLQNSKASECIRRNVLFSDGTLLITCGELFGRSDYYRKIAKNLKKKWLHLDLDKNTPFNCALMIKKWLLKNKIRILTVSGAKITDSPSIEKTVKKIFEAVWYMLADERPSINSARL